MTTRLLDHERLRQHRLKAEHFAAHPDLDQRAAREHEADELAYYSRPSKDDCLTAGVICFAILIVFFIAGSIAGVVL